MCFFVLLLLAAACSAATVTVVGGAATASVQTNSVFTSVDFGDGFFTSTSATDSQLSLNPFPADWATVREGTFLCDMTAVSSAPNIVSVLFGAYADPALSVTFARAWSLVAPGAFPGKTSADGNASPRTNLLYM